MTGTRYTIITHCAVWHCVVVISRSEPNEPISGRHDRDASCTARGVARKNPTPVVNEIKFGAKPGGLRVTYVRDRFSPRLECNVYRTSRTWSINIIVSCDIFRCLYFHGPGRLITDTWRRTTRGRFPVTSRFVQGIRLQSRRGIDQPRTNGP